MKQYDYIIVGAGLFDTVIFPALNTIDEKIGGKK